MVSATMATRREAGQRSKIQKEMRSEAEVDGVGYSKVVRAKRGDDSRVEVGASEGNMSPAAHTPLHGWPSPSSLATTTNNSMKL